MPTLGIVNDVTIDAFAKDSVALKGERAYWARRVVEFEFDSRSLECSGSVLASFDKVEKGKTLTRKVSIRLTHTDPAMVEFSHCSCPNGLIDCTHKVALLCYLRDNISKTDLRNVKFVDQPTKWNNTKVCELFPDTSKYKCNIPDEIQHTARSVLVDGLSNSVNPKPFLFLVIFVLFFINIILCSLGEKRSCSSRGRTLQGSVCT